MAERSVPEIVERSVDEIAHDPKYSNMFLGIREEKRPDGTSFGVLLIYSGSDPLVVINATRTVQKISGGPCYFFEPLVEGSERKVTLIGDGDSKILGSL